MQGINRLIILATVVCLITPLAALGADELSLSADRKAEIKTTLSEILQDKEIPDYHRDSASFSNRCGIGAVRIPALAKSVTIHSRLNR